MLYHNTKQNWYEHFISDPNLICMYNIFIYLFSYTIINNLGFHSANPHVVGLMQVLDIIKVLVMVNVYIKDWL